MWYPAWWTEREIYLTYVKMPDGCYSYTENPRAVYLSTCFFFCQTAAARPGQLVCVNLSKCCGSFPLLRGGCRQRRGDGKLAPWGKGIGKCFPLAAGNGRNLAPKLWLRHYVVWRKPLLIAQAIGFLLWANSFGFAERCQEGWIRLSQEQVTAWQLCIMTQKG